MLILDYLFSHQLHLKYLLAFELVAFLLLIAMIGAIVLASKKMNISYSELEENQIDALLNSKEKKEEI